MTIPVENKTEMADFKPIFYLIRKKLKAYAAYATACRENLKLQPGPTMEARVAAREARWAEIRKEHPEGNLVYRNYDISCLLTTHRSMRGKTANHGIKQEDVPNIQAWVIDKARKELAASAAETSA